MLRLNSILLNLRPNCSAFSSLVNQQQIRTLKRSKRKETKKQIKLPNSFHVWNKRFTRTNISRALVNRIYFRFEIYKLNQDLHYLKVTDPLIERVREKAYRKLHNLVILDEVYADKIFELYGNTENKLMTKRALYFAEMVELTHLVEKTGKSPNELYTIGIHYDRDGCPRYGQFRNSMFIELNPTQLETRNFYRLMEAKMYNPKFCLDFFPCNLSSYNHQSLIFFYLRHVFKRNYLSASPLNVFLTNYSKVHDEHLKEILSERDAAPNFLDIRIDHLGDDLSSNDKKLIVIVKQAKNELYYDHKANYILPMFINNDHLNYKAQNYYIDQLANKPNVEFVHVPSEQHIEEKSPLNFAFYYFVFDLLKSGLTLKESIQNGFDIFKKFTDEMRDRDVHSAKMITMHPLNKQKKFHFKQFDNLEDELS